MELGLGYKKQEEAFCCSVPLTKHPETRGKIEIKIYPPHCHVIVMFRSLVNLLGADNYMPKVKRVAKIPYETDSNN
jgi:hypothetical protein